MVNQYYLPKSNILDFELPYLVVQIMFETHTDKNGWTQEESPSTKEPNRFVVEVQKHLYKLANNESIDVLRYVFEIYNNPQDFDQEKIPDICLTTIGMIRFYLREKFSLDSVVGYSKICKDYFKIYFGRYFDDEEVNMIIHYIWENELSPVVSNISQKWPGIWESILKARMCLAEITEHSNYLT